jgi:hypothetical protein
MKGLKTWPNTYFELRRPALKASKDVTQAMQSLTRKFLISRFAPGRPRTCNPMIRSHELKPKEVRE